jgi:predicted amino acid dehydrogenase
VAALLAAEGRLVRVDSKRGGRKLPVEVCRSVEDAVAGAPLVVGAGPTGGSVDAQWVEPDAVVVDVAIPATLRGRPPKGVTVLAGEAVSMPPELSNGGWGPLYQVFAGYGPWQLFACVIEPLVMVSQGRREPYALGRKLLPDTVREFGVAAEQLGFRARLARGFFQVRPEGSRLQRLSTRMGRVGSQKD